MSFVNYADGMSQSPGKSWPADLKQTRRSFWGFTHPRELMKASADYP